ncbi:MAG TPA: hypothetical protein VNJ53_01630 [Gaiellaceae bacterium]|nr:hypothetical protein [Gaiellaceae bacterium]
MRAILAVVALAALVLAVAAQAYDRQPIRLAGLTPDGWGFTNLGAEEDVLDRYDGLRTAWCTGVIMLGWPRGDSTWLHGQTRYWDKSACTGTTWSGKRYALVYDAKGECARCFRVYRLRGIGARELHR